MAAKDATTRQMTARIGALTRWSNEDPKTGTAAMRAGRMASFERQVDPDGVLSPAERQDRAERAMKAHMLRMSAKARQRRAAA